MYKCIKSQKQYKSSLKGYVRLDDLTRYADVTGKKLIGNCVDFDPLQACVVFLTVPPFDRKGN